MDSRPDARPEAIGSEIRRYARIFYRQRWWILATTAGTLLITLALSALQGGSVVDAPVAIETGVTEQTIARVLLRDPDPAQAAVGVETITMATHAQLITSIDRLEKIRDAIAPELTPEEMLGSLAVVVQPDSRILSVGYTDSGEERAEAIVQALSNSYISDLERQDRRDLRRQLATLRARARSLAGGSQSTSKAATQIELLAVQQRALLVETALASLDRGEIVSTGRAPIPSATTTPAGVPLVAEAPPPSLARKGAAGLLLGLLLGFAVAMAREALDPRANTQRKLETELGLPVLFLQSDIPDPSHPAFARLLGMIERRVMTGGTLCVTGFASDGTIADAARALAQQGTIAGIDVVLVDAEEVDRAGGEHRMHIVPAPAYLSSPLASRLASEGAQLLLVIDGATSRTDEVRRALDELRHSGTDPIGAFLYRGEES